MEEGTEAVALQLSEGTVDFVAGVIVCIERRMNHRRG